MVLSICLLLLDLKQKRKDERNEKARKNDQLTVVKVQRTNIALQAEVSVLKSANETYAFKQFSCFFFNTNQLLCVLLMYIVFQISMFRQNIEGCIIAEDHLACRILDWSSCSPYAPDSVW